MLSRYTILDGKRKKQAVIYTAGEHNIDCGKIDPNAIKIIKKLTANGYKAYVVGGAVRDLLLGRTPKDFDITTDAEPEVIKSLFKNSRIIGKRFQLVHVFFGTAIFEVSTFRSTQNGSVGNVFGTIEEDSHRRDFSINALYFDPVNNLLIDFVDGVKAIRQKKLVPIIPLKRLFTEDPVRMLRAVKYSVLAECSMGFCLRRQLQKDGHLLEEVSPSRLTEEMHKIVKSGYSHDIIQRLVSYNLFMYLQPNATVLLEENTNNFANYYFASLRMLDASTEVKINDRLGKMIYYLIRDYLNLVLKNSGKQSAAFFYFEARHFVLPLNPPRDELHYAVSLWQRKDASRLLHPKTQTKSAQTKSKGTGC